MKRFGSKMVPSPRSIGLKQSSPVNRPAATQHKPFLGRFLFAIVSLVVAAFLSPTAKAVVGKYFGSLYKPKLELLAAAFVVVQGEDLTNNEIRQSTAIYDVRDHCLVSVFDSAGSRSSSQPENSAGLLFSQVDLYNGGRSAATNSRLAFLFSLPGKVTIETTPNLTFTTQSLHSQFLLSDWCASEPLVVVGAWVSLVSSLEPRALGSHEKSNEPLQMLVHNHRRQLCIRACSRPLLLPGAR